ncbi:Cyclin-dependent kinase 10 [Dinochytrium kinnereticum]|nr:Cyclin-dependent kinase 10 [Dinochytrium kinnereticum]
MHTAKKKVITIDFESGAKTESPYPFIGRCHNIEESYEKLERIGEGTYGIVYKARNKQSGDIIALKKMRNEHEREGVPISSLREIALLKSLQHENIVRVMEIAVGKEFGKRNQNLWSIARM